MLDVIMSVRLRLFLACLHIFAAGFQVKAQSAEFTVTISEDSPVVTTRRSNLTLSCHLTAGLQILLTHNVVWLKQSRVSGLTNDSLTISEWGRVVVDFPLSEHYRVNATNDAVSVTVALTISNVRDEDDGRYFCRAINKAKSAVDGEQSADIIVHNAVEAVNMKVGSNSVTKSTTKLFATELTVHCTARGSNPAAELALYLDNQQLKVNHVDTQVMQQASQAARAPRYSVDAEATLQLSMSDNGKELSCRTEGGKVIATVLAVVEKPTVTCTNVIAYDNEMIVRLSCLVEHADINIEDFVWEMDETDTVFSNDVPANSSTVTAEELSESETRVTLTLHVVRWGEGRMMFKLIAVTDAGDISGEAFLRTMPEREQNSAHFTHPQALLAVSGQLLVVIAVVLFA